MKKLLKNLKDETISSIEGLLILLIIITGVIVIITDGNNITLILEVTIFILFAIFRNEEINRYNKTNRIKIDKRKQL